ncbi:MAG TPA: DUF2339 domain-containing protein [Planctomycetota bacterium]|nr:DUF2339 domain-containing protein [Planctomycetota bacterium]
MLDHVLLRLRHLEERVTELESRLDVRVAGGAGAVAPTPPPLPQDDAPEPEPEPQPQPADAGSPAPRAPAWPAPADAEPEPAAPRRAQHTDLERFVGLTILGRVGAAALLLAAAYFGQLGWERLGPVGRVALVYGAGLALVGAGHLLRARVSPYYTAVLWGAGTAMTYVAGALASLRYGLVPDPVAMLLLFASAALGQLLARVLRFEAFATVALAGAYAAPVLVGSPSPTPTAFFVVLLTLHAWAAWTERAWSWRAARGLAVVATVALATGWYVWNGRVSTGSFVSHVEAVTLLLAAPELAAALLGGAVPRARWSSAVIGIACTQAVLLFDTWMHFEWTGFGLVAGAAWLAVAAVLVRRNEARGPGVARLGGLLVAFGALQVWQASSWPAGTAAQVWVQLATLSAVGPALLVQRRWLRVGELGACVAAILAANVVLTHCAPSTESRLQVVAALLVPAALVRTARPSAAAVFALLLGCVTTLFGLCPRFEFAGPLAHWVAIAVAATGGVATLGAVQAGLRRDRNLLVAAVGVLVALALGWALMVLEGPLPGGGDAGLVPFWNVRFGCLLALFACLFAATRVLRSAEPVARRVLAVAMFAVGYLGGLMELLELIRDWPGGWSDVATSLYTLAFAGGLLLAGFLKQRSDLRWAGLIGFGIVVVKLGLHDLRMLETPLRVLATGVLGLAMLLGAFAYGRRRVGGD